MSYDLLLQQALKQHENGNWNEAERVYRQILETAPNQPEVLNLLGLIAQAKGADTEACELFAQAIRQKNDNPAFYYNLAFSLKNDGKLHEALDNFQKALNLKPDIKEAYNETALLYQRLGDLETARRYWKMALDLDCEYVEAKANLAMSYENEDLNKAISELEKIIQNYPQDGRTLFYLCQLYIKNKDYTKAQQAAIEAKTAAPFSDEVQTILGQLAVRDNKNVEAQACFEQALAVNPRNIAALKGRADVYCRLGNYEQAEKYYKKALENDNTDWELHNNYAEMLCRQKRTAEALEEYRQAVIINPKSAEVSNNLGTVLKSCGDYEQALGLFFNAMNLDENLEEAQINAVETLILVAQKDAADAQKIVENWLRQKPDNLFARHLLNSLKGETSEIDIKYNQRLFEHFADSYELVVANLDYQAPLAVGRFAGSLKTTIVDLGCGTGLVGEIVKNSENHLTGVDISPKMLAKAKAKGVYEELVCDDAVSFLQHHPDFDWAIAVDVLGYIGDPSPLFAAAGKADLLFTTENLDDENGYKLFLNGRYKHSPGYITAKLSACGFKVEMQKVVLRKENGVPVQGTIWKARH